MRFRPNPMPRTAHKSELGVTREVHNDDRGSMLYLIDSAKNNSKFYEMYIDQTPSGKYILKRRWGALTDRIGGGRVDNKIDEAPSLHMAQQMMKAIYQQKVGKGYVDAYGTKHRDPQTGKMLAPGEYPIGLDRKPGFGWGTQAIVKELPTLEVLHKQVTEAIQILQGRNTTPIAPYLNAIEQQLKTLHSDTADKLVQYCAEVQKQIAKMPGEYQFLRAKDIERGLQTIANYIDKQTAFHKRQARLASQLYRTFADAAVATGDPRYGKGHTEVW